MTKDEILKRIEVEDTRIANSQRNVEGLTKQISNSQEEIKRLQALLEALPAE
jgi:uncharacterized coiled-coil protein SlyX